MEDMANYMIGYRDRNHDFRERQNEKAKEYHKTLRGRLALKASALNRGWAARGGDGKITANDLMMIWREHGGLDALGEIRREPSCSICGNTLSTFQPFGFIMDHVLPKCSGGKNEKSNIQLLCYKCNLVKSSIDQRRPRKKRSA